MHDRTSERKALDSSERARKKRCQCKPARLVRCPSVSPSVSLSLSLAFDPSARLCCLCVRGKLSHTGVSLAFALGRPHSHRCCSECVRASTPSVCVCVQLAHGYQAAATGLTLRCSFLRPIERCVLCALAHSPFYTLLCSQGSRTLTAIGIVRAAAAQPCQ